MALVRRIARPLLAAPFVVEGVRTALRPERSLDVLPQAFSAADSALGKSSVPAIVDSRTILRAAGLLAAGAGVAYAAGRCPRGAAAVLLATTTVGWAGRRRIWELSGEERLQELQSIVTDAGLLGGVLLAVVDHDGKPSLGYQFEQFVDRAQKNAAQKQKEIGKRTAALEKKAKSTVKDARTSLSVQQG
ncbi:hypothetical protein ACXET9_06990 [Brachybacterium sp. DNPG3]